MAHLTLVELFSESFTWYRNIQSAWGKILPGSLCHAIYDEGLFLQGKDIHICIFNKSLCLSHVCWTKIMFIKNAKRWYQYFSSRDNSPVQGICVPKSNPFTCWYFGPKNGSKQPKMGVKSLILVWYGLVLSS